ncbi:integrase, catalytic region, zinc finger, CCHC-type containing protein [Tanacetum coccineum]
MTTLAEFMIIAGADNRPPMLEKSLTKKYEELSATEKIQADCDCKATNIVLQGLPSDVYAIVNHHKVAKDIWDKFKLLMQGTKLSLQEKECKLYDEFDKFTFVKGETLYQYYWRFSQLINNMNVINMFMRAVQVNTKFLNSLQPEWSLVVPLFNPGDDLIACLNKAMTYKGNATSFGENNTSGQARVVKCYNCQGEGHMARQCTQPKRPRNAAWLKDKAMSAEAQEAGQILYKEQLAFLADPGIPDALAIQTTIPNNVAFQTEDLDTYASDCDDVSLGKANQEKNNELLTAELERYKERVKTFEQSLIVDLSSHEKMIDSQTDDMIKEKLALKEQVDSLEQNLSKQIKEKEYLLQTFIIFKNESREKKSKYMENEIDLEKKIKKLDNIVYKVGQSA